MAYVIAQVWGPLLVAALCGGVAGWFWHAGRLRPRQLALEAERRRLRAELLDLAVGRQSALATGDGDGDDENSKRRIAALERELAEARGRGAEADVLRRRLADLEQAAGGARPVAAVDVTDYTTRIAALEVEIEAARRKVSEAEALQARAAELSAPAEAPPQEDVDLHKWRARYFEARTAFLEDGARTDAAALDQTRAQLSELQAKAAQRAPEDADKLQLVWRNRYLAERLKYVEHSVAAPPAAIQPPAPPPVDQEAEDRRRWRMRYLEQRLAYLEEKAASASPPVDVAPLHAKIADLEGKSAAHEATSAKLIDAEDEVIRSRWTARYLQARVSYLESCLAEAARRAEPSETKAREPEPAMAVLELAPKPAPTPEPDVFRMERPPMLAAARNGAPDDLTRIQGVTALNESALRALGVHHYEQIANWTAAHAAWVNQYLNLGGRIARENWIDQAKKLAAA